MTDPIARPLRFSMALRADERALLKQAAHRLRVRTGAFVRQAALRAARRTLHAAGQAFGSDDGGPMALESQRADKGCCRVCGRPPADRRFAERWPEWLQTGGYGGGQAQLPDFARQCRAFHGITGEVA